MPKRPQILGPPSIEVATFLYRWTPHALNEYCEPNAATRATAAVTTTGSQVVWPACTTIVLPGGTGDVVCGRAVEVMGARAEETADLTANVLGVGDGVGLAASNIPHMSRTVPRSDDNCPTPSTRDYAMPDSGLMTGWHEEPGNAAAVTELQELISDRGRVLVFLGAGLSFGASRKGSRARFEPLNGKAAPPGLPPHGGEDDRPLPSWPLLISRMKTVLDGLGGIDQDALDMFFREEGPLDCAELFRQLVGEANYGKFLKRQFDIHVDEETYVTPSHHALVDLDLPLIFTTNYDQLIEDAYLQTRKRLTVSSSESDFKGHRTERPHLVKMHGTIDKPDTIVLTRTDYAQSRVERREMFEYLRGEMSDAAFLFVGFSLTDPNFNLLHDDIRLAYGGINLPPSYTVQAARNVVKEAYLRSLNINTVWIGNWSYLPDFLMRIKPKITV